MKNIAGRDMTPEIAGLLVAGLLAMMAAAAVAAVGGQSSGVRMPSSPIQLAPSEERASAMPAGSVSPTLRPASDPTTEPRAPTPEPKISTPLPSEKVLPTEIPAQAPSSFRPGSNRIPMPSVPPQN